jgi:peroxiredoxin
MVVMRRHLPPLVLVLAAACSPRNPPPPPQPVGDTSDCEANAWPTVLPAYTGYEGTAAYPGDLLTDFALPDQDGQTTCYRQFLGAVSVVDISSEWCGPCNEAAATSMDLLAELRELHGSTWLVTMMVQDERGAPAQVRDAREWADRYGIDYPVVVDDRERFRNAWGVLAFPVFLFVGPDGTVYERFEGAPEDAQIVELVRDGIEEYGDLLRPPDAP